MRFLSWLRYLKAYGFTGQARLFLKSTEHGPAAAILIFTGLMLAACSTPAQRRAAEIAAIKKQAAEKVERICALHGAEREPALEKLKKDSGLELYCAPEK